MLYVTTGDNYSEPGTAPATRSWRWISKTGKILWIAADDGERCLQRRLPHAGPTNCPDVNGPDFDFAASPILVTLPNGKRALVAGQKSGVVHALDPDNQGEVIWQVRVGHGGSMGGVQWGSAADQANVYVARFRHRPDPARLREHHDADPKQGGGMFALRLNDGERVWYTPPAHAAIGRDAAPRNRQR